MNARFVLAPQAALAAPVVSYSESVYNHAWWLHNNVGTN
jgi:hypothetical protein